MQCSSGSASCCTGVQTTHCKVIICGLQTCWMHGSVILLLQYNDVQITANSKIKKYTEIYQEIKRLRINVLL